MPDKEEGGKVEKAAKSATEKGGKSVNFSAFNQTQDVRGKIKSSKSMGGGGDGTLGKSGSMFQSFTGKGTAASKAASRKRRFWRKVKMRLNPRYWLHMANKKLPIIHPNAWYRVSWDIFVLILVLYNAVIVPYEVGFSTPEPSILIPLNYAIDIIFAIDICFNFRTSYFDRTATLVRDGGRIFSHYSATWFPVDLFATIPYEGIVFISPAVLSPTEDRLVSLLRLPRLLRLARLLRFFDRLRGANYIRMVKLTMAMGFMAHFITCAWRFVYELAGVPSHEWSYDVLGDNSAQITYFLNGYQNSFLTMIGNDIGPANDVERAFAIFIVVGGACFYAIIIGNMSVLINSMNPTASRHKFKKDMVANTVRYLGIPVDTQQRISQYFEYLTTYQHPGPEAISLLSQLPHSMFHDITNWMFFEIVNKVPLFQDCDKAFIAQLVMRLKLNVFLPGENIFHIGDVGHEMYFITKGHIAVMNDDTEMLALLGKGGFFGELALLATARRTAQCTALSSCDLACLKAPDLVAAMRGFPETATKVRERAMGRLANLKTAGNAAVQQQAQQAKEVPRYLKMLNPEAAKAEAEKDQSQAGGTTLSVHKLQYHTQQMQLQEAKHKAVGAWQQQAPEKEASKESPAEAQEAGSTDRLKRRGSYASSGGAAGSATQGEGSVKSEGLSERGRRSLGFLNKRGVGNRSKHREQHSKDGGKEDQEEGLNQSPEEWTRSTLALVAHAQGSLISISTKLNSLHEAVDEFNTRLEKVDTGNDQNETAEPEYNIFESGID